MSTQVASRVPDGSSSVTSPRLARYYAPSTSQIVSWFLRDSGIAEGLAAGASADEIGAHSADEPWALERYTSFYGDRDAALQSLGQQFLDAADAALESAARNWILPPAWVKDALTDAGRRRYEGFRLKHNAMARKRGFLLPGPVPWMGGKSRHASSYLPLYPPHVTYSEPFGGMAGLLYGKIQAEREVYNDADPDLVNLMRVIQDPRAFARFYETNLRNMAKSEHLFNFSMESYKDYSFEYPDNVERAWRWYAVGRLSVGGRWGDMYLRSDDPEADEQKWRNAVAGLPLRHARIQGVTISNSDAVDVIRKWDSSTTLFFVDPPYDPEERNMEATYNFEYTLKQHRELVRVLLKVKGTVILAGYPTDLYHPLEHAGWGTLRKDVALQTDLVVKDQTRKRRIEGIWFSPHIADFVNFVAPVYGWKPPEAEGSSGQAKGSSKASVTKRST